jgi:hypothetical protein
LKGAKIIALDKKRYALQGETLFKEVELNFEMMELEL